MRWCSILAGLAIAVACSHGADSRDRPAPVAALPVTPAAPAAAPAAAPPAADLVIGEYKLARVVDGDTIKVDGLDASLRLLGIDTEETFKHAKERAAYAAGWDAYVAGARGSSPRPVKFATPLGDAAKTWAEQWFAGVATVRLERDHAQEIHDRYGRLLAYVLANKDGVWKNYNVEAVRAGMSPYFPKYGGSRRFAADFAAAEAEAKAAKRGIWAPGAQAYPDYPERQAWWAARGAFVDAFRAEAAKDPSRIELSHEDALAELERRVGNAVAVLGTVQDVRTEKGPIRVYLAHAQHSDLAVIFRDPAVFETSKIAQRRGEFVIVSGKPSIYENPRSHTRQVEIVVTKADQVRVSDVPGTQGFTDDAP